VAVLRPLSLGFGGGVCMNPSWLFSLWFPSRIREQRGSNLGFVLSRVRGVLDGISSIPLVLASFGGPNLGYGVPMRRSYYPKSLVRIRGANQDIGSWIWRSWSKDCCSSRAAQAWPVWLVLLIGLNGASPLWDLHRVNVLVSSVLSCVAAGMFLAGFEEFG
jgi:hypothetical protein